MDNAKLIKTPMGTIDHIDLDMAGTSVDQKVYRSMIGFLLYLCASRSDIMLFKSDQENNEVSSSHI
jgi:hypothetical protein